jgi:hypothetical protein
MDHITNHCAQTHREIPPTKFQWLGTFIVSHHFLLFLVVLRIEPTASSMLSKHPATSPAQSSPAQSHSCLFGGAGFSMTVFLCLLRQAFFSRRNKTAFSFIYLDF